MTRNRSGLLVLVLVGLVSLCGANCVPLAPREGDLTKLPPVLPSVPSLAQVVEAVNANTAKVQNFSAPQATLSVPGAPQLTASVSYEQPTRFRLQAEFIAGQEVDLGSNDELFWFWVRRNEPRGVYYCRHGEFARSPLRQSIPIDPYWLIEALGVVRLDPAARYQGPYLRPDKNLELRVVQDTPQGPTTRILILDPRLGVVYGQYLYDARNQLLASAITGRYRHDPTTGALLPTVVEVRAPAVQGAEAFSMRLELGAVTINRPLANAEQLWTMPTFEGFPFVDLCNPGRSLAPAAPPGPVPYAYQPR